MVRGTLGIICLLTIGYTFLDYWSYSLADRLAGGSAWWNLVLQGRFYAPEQYRIGVIRLAGVLTQATRLHLRHAFAIIDFASVAASQMLLARLLFRSPWFRQADRAGRWVQVLILLGGSTLYLSWTLWFQQPETDMSLLLLTLSATATCSRHKLVGAILLVALASVEATIRADAAAAFSGGFLLASLLPAGHNLPLGRGIQAVSSAAAILVAGGVQWYITHRMYPAAPRINGAFQLLSNLKAWIFYPVLASSLFPWIWTVWMAARSWRVLDGWSVGMVLGSVAHFLLFYTFGIAWEVRIFLPFATITLPLTAAFFSSLLVDGRGSAACSPAANPA